TMSKKPYDQAFKYIAEDDARSLLILLGHLKPDEAAIIERLPLELSVSTIATDQTYRVTTDSGSLIVHPEAQLRWEADVPEIVTEYDARLWMAHRLPIINYILIFTRKGFPRTIPRFGKIKAGALEIKTKLKIVKIWELLANRFLTLQRSAILPFIP